MATRRMISRRISQSKKLNRVSLKSQLLWTWQLPYLDDYGCYTADPEDIKFEVCPKNKNIEISDIESCLDELYVAKLIHLYDVDDRPYQQYIQFNDFQTFRTDRSKVANYPVHTMGVPRHDMHALREVKLREVKISKDLKTADQIVDKPVDNVDNFGDDVNMQQEDLDPDGSVIKELMAKIYSETNFNIYKYLSYAEHKIKPFPPMDALRNALEAYYKEKTSGKVSDDYPWLNRILDQFKRDYWASHNSKIHDQTKNQPSVLKDIMKGVLA